MVPFYYHLSNIYNLNLKFSRLIFNCLSQNIIDLTNSMKNILSFPIYNFKLIFEANEEMRLPLFKGSMFRGAFGWTFRKLVCITKAPDCNGCLIQNQCSYFKVFETELPAEDLFFLKGVKKSPHPFIIHPAGDEVKTKFNKGDSLNLGFTIISDYVKLLPYFVYTFMELGKTGIGVDRAKLTLKHLLFKNELGEFVPILTSDGKLTFPEKPSISVNHSIDRQMGIPNSIKLTFKTPVRLQAKGYIIDYVSKINPEIFIRAFYRRYYAIFSLFGGLSKDLIEIPEEIIDSITIKENDLRYVDIERYSSRQKTKMKFGGLIGSLVLSGDLKEVYPIIKEVQKFNLGKNTAFGYGEFIVEELL